MLKARLVPTDLMSRRDYYWTPGVELELPKFWSCRKRDLATEHLRTTERILGQVDDEDREAAEAYARAHERHLLPHLSWRGSLTLHFSARYRIKRIKFWYMGNPNKVYAKKFPDRPGNRTKLIEVFKRKECEIEGCSRFVTHWIRETEGTASWYINVCEAHQ